MKTLSKLLVPLMACVPMTTPAHGGDEIAIIVHKDTEVSSIERTELRPIFQTKKTSLSGEKLMPLNLPDEDDARQQFDAAVLGLGPDRVARYWIDRQIRGGNPPPRSISNEDLVLRIVSAKRGAIGYVPMSAVTPQVKVVAKIRGGTVLAP